MAARCEARGELAAAAELYAQLREETPPPPIALFQKRRLASGGCSLGAMAPAAGSLGFLAWAGIGAALFAVRQKRN